VRANLRLDCNSRRQAISAPLPSIAEMIPGSAGHFDTHPISGFARWTRHSFWPASARQTRWRKLPSSPRSALRACRTLVCNTAEAVQLRLALRPFFEFGLAAGCEIARSTGHVAVRMIFDAAHVQSMDGDLLGHMERNWDLIKVV
jgi:hypothetical protein